jgi:hypothetical protein
MGTAQSSVVGTSHTSIEAAPSSAASRLPNFLIAGMPKCGTTALYEYLRTNPRIYLPAVKEPHYFAEDLGRHREVPMWDDYVRLFAASNEQHVAVGDASPWYVHSQVALERIRHTLPDVRLIVMLRPPDEFIRSLHSDMCWICFEDQVDLEAAWQLQSARQSGEQIPRLCQVPWFLQYLELARFGKHLRRLYSFFPPELVKVILLEDMRAAPGRVYDDVLAFLGVESDGRESFPRVNTSKANRFTWLARWQTATVQAIPRPVIKFGRKFGLGLLNRRIQRLNSQARSALPLRPEFRAALLAELSADIDDLADLLGRSLDHWKS